MNILREEIAYISHEIWAHWMRYLFKCGYFNDDGSFVIPAEKVERWQRQIDTPYSQLSEAEKESDRHQADKILDVVVREHKIIDDATVDITYDYKLKITG